MKREYIYFTNGTVIYDDSANAKERYLMYELAEEQYERKQRREQKRITQKLNRQRQIGATSISVGLTSLLLCNTIPGMIVLIAPAIISGCILMISKCVVM